MTNSTKEQQDFIDHPGDVLLKACPGAGKTKAIVARYLKRVREESRNGVALLSFTKAAIEEVRQRCVDVPDCFECPNFAGTFDGFINRHITGPLYARRYGHHLEFIESWDLLPSAFIKVGHYSLSLEWFDFDSTDNSIFVPRRVQSDYRIDLIRQVASKNDELCRQAQEKRTKLVRDRHIASSSASRRLAVFWLSQTDESCHIARLLGRRFVEIIVDEAQDCGVQELTILSFLRSAGIRVTMVADLDQAIYEFREAVPSDLLAFAADLNSEPLVLNGNFRSSPAICLLNDSLRFGGSKDAASGECASLDTPVYLLEYSSSSQIQSAARQIYSDNSLDPSKSIVLAYGKKVAQRAAGVVAVSNGGSSRLVIIADAGITLRRRTAEPYSKVKAIEKVERILIDCVDQTIVRNSTLDGACLAVGLERTFLREMATRLVMTAHATVSREVFAKKIREIVDGLDWPTGIKLRKLSAFLRAPSEGQWRQIDAVSPQECLRYGHVHSVKGREFDAVTLVIPKKLHVEEGGTTAIDHWRDGMNAESRRVMYVGASRARRLVVLAVHGLHAGEVAKILDRDGVPYRRVSASG